MHSHLFLSVLVATFSLVAAAPATSESIQADSTLSLIKTSELDPGTWVTEEEKIVNYVSKNIGFIDITDITDEKVLERLSTVPSEESALAARAVTYPTTLTHQTEANALIAKVTIAGPQTWLTPLTKSTYGTQAGTWLLSQVKTIAGSNSAITVSTFAHTYDQPSIIVKIPGTTSDLVIVGAHYDSTGGSSTARGPGADDDGSGVVVILEALRVLADAKFAPKNTLEFHFYSGEEGGLLGSQAVFQSYSTAKKNVLAFLNQDMAGYSPSGKISVYSDYVDASLTAYVRRVVLAYTGAASTTDKCGYGCSDHASAYAVGFPAAYACDEVMSTSSPYIHSPQDTIANIQWPTILRHSKFTVGFLVEASYL